MDLFGNAGAEHFSRALRRPGEYRVRVGSFMEELGEFSIGATWLPVVAIEVPPDPDGSPDTATMLVPGTPLEDTLDDAVGDAVDWYIVEATADIVVTVITEGEDDVFLEAYVDGDFSSYTDRSDQDLQGSGGNESVTVRLRTDEKAYFKVMPFSGSVWWAWRQGLASMGNSMMHPRAGSAAGALARGPGAKRRQRCSRRSASRSIRSQPRRTARSIASAHQRGVPTNARNVKDGTSGRPSRHRASV